MSSRRSTSTASRREPPTVVTGDRLPPGQANPDLTASPPPDTPTMGAEDGSGQLRGEAGCNAGASPSSRPERGGRPRLGAVSVRRTGFQRGEGFGAVPSRYLKCGSGWWCHSPFFSALTGGLEGNLEKPEGVGGGVLSQAEIPRGRKTAQNRPKGPV